MRQLFPVAVDPVDPADVYGEAVVASGRPSVRLNMIVSADGATSVEGLSGALGGAADRQVFAVLRSFADAILVAAGTLRTEHYGPARLPPDVQAARRARGQAPVPPIAVVSRSCMLDWQSSFFTDATARPMVITVGDAPAEHRARAADVADVIIAGASDVDLVQALDAIGERGAQTVLAEGGPTLNGELARAGVLDELCLTLAPRLAGGNAKRILAGSVLGAVLDLQLCSVCEESDFLFLRYRV